MGGIGDVWNDAKIAVRTLLRRPGTSLVIVLTLGIGLAASTTVFTVFDLLVLGPLPFHEPDRLVRLRQTRELPGQGVRASSVTGRDFTAWRERTSVFRDMAAARFRTLSLTGEGEPERVVGIEATWTHFPVLGVEPLLGRTFGPDEDAAGAPAPVAVISHSLWTRRYGRDPSVVGEEIVVAGRPYTVLGVMPEGFRYPYSAEVWLPLGLSPDGEEWERGILNVSARMAEGVSLEGVRGELDAVASSLEAERPETNRGAGIRVIPVREEVLEGMDQKVRALLWAALFVLLIATANVASMVLARALRRQDELSVRVALGASRVDLVRPALVEGLLLSVAGAALGLTVASWAGPPLAAMSPVDDVADFFRDVGVTGRVAAFGLAAAALVGVLFTLPAAVRAIRHRSGAALSRSRGGGGGSGERRVLDGLIVTEVAVAVVLLTGAGLMVQSLRNLQATDLGLDVDGLAVFAVSPSTAGYARPGERMLLMDEIVERVRGLRAVEDAAVTNFNPLRDQGWGAAVWPVDRAPSAEQSSVTVNHRAVTPGFFRTAGIELLAGRGFRESDGPGSPDVAVVAESLAKRLWPGEDPVGRRLRAGAADELDAPVVTVVGVVEDVADFGEIEGTWYRPLPQDPSEFPTATLEIFVRSPAASGEPVAFESLVAAVRDAVGDVAPALPVFDVQRARSIVRFERRMESFTALLLAVFAGAGLVLAAVGVYGVLTYTVGRRTREIGIRQVLGASPGQVIGLVLRGALAVTGLGILLGVGAAALLTRFLESFLVGVSPLDPLVFAAVAAGCLAVALMAAWVPARRATTVEPRSALAEP